MQTNFALRKLRLQTKYVCYVSLVNISNKNSLFAYYTFVPERRMTFISYEKYDFFYNSSLTVSLFLKLRFCGDSNDIK